MHPFFEGVDIEALERKEVEPPFKPNFKELKVDKATDQL